MPIKICKKCLIIKNTTLFNKAKTGIDGLRGDCKECQSKLNKKYKTPAKSLNTQQWKEVNKDRVISTNGLYYKKNEQYFIDYRKANKEHHNQYIRERRLKDDVFRLSTNIRNLIRISFKRNGFNKNSKTSFILGCSYEEFKAHIESNWKPWMNWDNYGLYNGVEGYGWDIDHIIPVSIALNETELIKLNNYTNLQPLCSKVNRDIKKAKTI